MSEHECVNCVVQGKGIPYLKAIGDNCYYCHIDKLEAKVTKLENVKIIANDLMTMVKDMLKGEKLTGIELDLLNSFEDDLKEANPDG
jgi:hypothetical protein